jgi:small GTP-binding protein
MALLSYKVIVVGDAGVGKTSIANRRCCNEFTERVPMTVGISNLTTIVQVRGSPVELKIWDTAGQEKYSALIPMFSRNSDVCIIVADASNLESLRHLPKWERTLRDSGCSAPIAVAVNKIDLVEDFDPIHATGFHGRYEHVLFVSAKTGNQIDLLFTLAGEIAVQQGKPAMGKREAPPVDVSEKICC